MANTSSTAFGYADSSSTNSRTLYAVWYPNVVVPNSNDSCAKVSAITQFINNNRYIGSSKQIGIQGDGKGNFYVKAGSFTNNSDPGITSSGTLIYAAGSSAPKSSAAENYKYAAHLGNILNYILSQTKGSGYGSATALFSDSGPHQQVSLSKGVFYAEGDSYFFRCNSNGYASGYLWGSPMNNDNIYSNFSFAVWW